MKKKIFELPKIEVINLTDDFIICTSNSPSWEDPDIEFGEGGEIIDIG